jgi:hypothetical protein
MSSLRGTAKAHKRELGHELREWLEALRRANTAANKGECHIAKIQARNAAFQEGRVSRVYDDVYGADEYWDDTVSGSLRWRRGKHFSAVKRGHALWARVGRLCPSALDGLKLKRKRRKK